MLVEEGSVEGVADVNDMCFSHVQQFFYGGVVILARQEEPEVSHWYGSKGHDFCRCYKSIITKDLNKTF